MTLAQVFSRTDLVTDSERFYNSILELLDDVEEKEEVDQLMTWWNRQVFCHPSILFIHEKHRQIFPLYTEVEQLPSKNSALAWIRQKRMERLERGGAGRD